jgi:NAD(P)-dependent dehydrogenase (short-subunit alcohol dehydrogenase family)
MSLNGKNALITGSSRGIGRGIALKLAQHGANVGVHYHQNEAAALETLAQVRELGADGFVVQADVLRPEEITQMFGRVKAEFGKLEIFVSNARPEAAAFFYPPMDITLEQWNAASDSQAKAFLVGVHEVVPLMSKGGRILAITYAQGSRTGGLQPWVAMGSAKAAVGVACALFCGHSRQTRYYGECHQPRMDRRQRIELAARAGSGTHP